MMLSNNQSHESLFIRYKTLFLCITLAICTFTVYVNVVGYEFVNFDDDTYVTENAYVQEGLTLQSVSWAFQLTNDLNAHWHPLTWLSHMLDVQLFGLTAGMHHLTSLLIHIANAIILFLVFYRTTGAYFKSASVALLFALHPLNVDSVAWIAERKNVLSTFFFMLTLFTYIRYTLRPSAVRYVITICVFLLGMMSKPMLASIPFLLLLLDYWPLKRFQFGPLNITDNAKNGKKEKSKKLAPHEPQRSLYNLILEKIPFFIIAVIIAYLSSLATKDILIPSTTVPFSLRISNGLISYLIYIKQMIWPMNLAVFYPFPKSIPLYQTIISGICLAGVTFFITINLKRLPFLATGWFWYLGTLIPVIGIVQVGLWPSTADRWTYIPLIGLFIILAWGSDELLTKWPYKKKVLALFATGFLLFLMTCTWLQIRHWENSITLFEHNLEVTPNNSLAHNSLGLAMDEIGMTHEAIDHFSKAIQLDNTYAKARYNLGNSFFSLKEFDEAVFQYSEALRIKPDYAKAHNNLGNALAVQGRLDEALHHYKAALRSNPNLSQSRHNLKKALYEKDKLLNTIDETKDMLIHRPADAKLHYLLGDLYISVGDFMEAETHYKSALSIDPAFMDALRHLTRIYFYKAEYDNAISICIRITKLKPDEPDAYFYIASMYALKNDVDSSLDWLKKALEKGYDNWEIIQSGWAFQNIRQSPGYNELIHRQ